MTNDKSDFEAFFNAYVECALWSSTAYGHGEAEGEPCELGESCDCSFERANYDASDLAPECEAAMREDCRAFIDSNAADLAELDAGQCGHDFWLTRNWHGTGFWDRGYGDLGQRLTAASHPYGEVYLYVGEDGMVYGD